MFTTTEIWSRILKIIAKIWGVFVVVLFGIVGGIIGIGPAGNMSTGQRIVSLFFIGLGIMYWLPNEKILPYKKIYLVLTLFPIVDLIAMSVHGIDSFFVMDLATVLVLIMICLYLAAPVSLILHMKSKQ